MSRGGFSLAWQDYNSTMCAGLQELQQRAEFVDMTIAADGHLVRVHQLVVGLASPFLKQLIRSTPAQHPVLFLNSVSHKVLCCLLEYMYTGEAVVPADDLKAFVTTGKALHVKGLQETIIQETANASVTPASSLSSLAAGISSVVSNSVENADTENKETSAEQASPVETVNPHLRNDAICYSKHGQKRKSNFSELGTAVSTVKRLDTSQIPMKIHKKTDFFQHSNEDFIDENTSHNSDNEESTSINSAFDNMLNKTLKPQLMFCRSNKGGLQLILNRFMYNLAHTYKDGRKRWECVHKKNNCDAGAITEDNTLINRFNTHTHAVHDRRIMAKVKDGCVYASLEIAESTKD